jgi:uncharacterized membrane protein (DUF4010 family)
MIAWGMMFARIAFQVAVLNMRLLEVAWFPLIVSGLAGFVFSGYLYYSKRSQGTGHVQFSNPVDIFSALRFGLIYAVILVVTRSAQLYVGESGILLSSFLAGFSDSNAITLSLAELSRDSGLSLQTAKLGLVLASMTNTIFKGLIVYRSGSPALRRFVFPGLVLILVVGVGAALLP